MPYPGMETSCKRPPAGYYLLKCTIDTAICTALCSSLVVCEQAQHVQQMSESLQRSDGIECVHGFDEYQEAYLKSKKPCLEPLGLWLLGTYQSTQRTV